MKIKNDFITNSSSASFIIEVEEKLLRKRIEEDFRFYSGESFRCFNNKKSLLGFVQGTKADWVTEARGVPYQYWNMGEEAFKAASKVLDNGNFPIYTQISRNKWDRVERILRILERYHNGKIVYRGGY